MPSKTDIWMPLYIGDYLADTSHLDAERHGCYLLWMMHYWRKGPLTTDLSDLVSIGRLRGSDASSIAQALLDEFFVKNGDGFWHQKRQDAERAKWQGKKDSAVEKAKKAAEGRWKGASSIASSNASSKPQAMLERCPLPLPLPSTQVQKPSRAKAADLDQGSELMLANWILEEAGVVADNSTRLVAATAIRLLSREGGTTKDAADYILAAAKESMAAGEVVNRFWFSDQRYRPGDGKRKPKQPKFKPRTEEQIRDEEANALAIWESMSEEFKRDNPWTAAQPFEAL